MLNHGWITTALFSLVITGLLVFCAYEKDILYKILDCLKLPGKLAILLTLVYALSIRLIAITTNFIGVVEWLAG